MPKSATFPALPGIKIVAKTLADSASRGCLPVQQAALLDAGTAFTKVADADLDIYWGDYLGTTDEILALDKLSEVGDKIADLRGTRKAEKGWIMDTYLLR